MSKKIRDFLFYFFVVAFIVGTTLLSLYASGYKFNLSWPLNFNRLLVKTGMLALDSSPKGAMIYIDGELEADSSWRPWKQSYLITPAKVKNMMPGDYEVRFEKEGYWPFQRKISIHSGQTTFLEDITLFKSGNPNITAIVGENSENEKIFLSESGKYVYLSETGLIVKLENGEQKQTENIEASNNDANWQKGDKLFLQGMLYTADSKTPDENYRQLIGSSSSDWKLDQDNSNIYYRNDNSLNSFNLNQKRASIVISDSSFIDYQINENRIFLISKKNNNTVLQEFSLNNKVLGKEFILPNNGDYYFVSAPTNMLALRDRRNEAIYIFNQGAIDQGYRSIAKANDWDLANDGTIFFINNWEIQRFNIEQNKSELLTRLSEPLKEISADQKDNYLIFNSEKKIGVYDLKTGFVTIVLEADKIGSSALDTKNDILYFWGKVGGQAGVYSIPIK